MLINQKERIMQRMKDKSDKGTMFKTFSDDVSYVIAQQGRKIRQFMTPSGPRYVQGGLTFIRTTPRAYMMRRLKKNKI